MHQRIGVTIRVLRDAVKFGLVPNILRKCREFRWAGLPSGTFELQLQLLPRYVHDSYQFIHNMSM